MTQFIQLHLLTAYPPSNLNRDDLGRPKTAVMGGKQRLRISSQCLKRAWRTSDYFKSEDYGLSNHMGTRTKEMGCKVADRLIKGGVTENKAQEWAGIIAGVFGNLKKNGLEIEQLAHFSPEEEKAVMALVDQLISSGKKPNSDDLKLLSRDHTAVDIAMFGRMLAGSPYFNTEAAVQVSHAITVHETVVEEDYFTAVDDLNEGIEDVGAGHVGESEFGSGLFYTYVCINCDLLVKNLSGRDDLAVKTQRALAEAAATVAPSGKQNSYASRAFASYIMAEKGARQPRSLAVSFIKPVSGYGRPISQGAGPDMLAEAIHNLEKTCEAMDQAYGSCAEARQVMNVPAGKGTLSEILQFMEGD